MFCVVFLVVAFVAFGRLFFLVASFNLGICLSNKFGPLMVLDLPLELGLCGA